MVDYIIVGAGIAGICFAETAMQNGKSFIIFDNNSQSSSKIAAGIYNPVILKRFSQVWNATEQLIYSDQFYSQIENKLQVQFDFKLPIVRKFFSIEEQNNWFAASDKVNLSPFLSANLLRTSFKGIDSPFDYGQVKETGYVNTADLLHHYHSYLFENNLLLKQEFDFNELELQLDFVKYKDTKAKHIIFAEGFGMHDNPYFKYLPLDGTKGEILVIKAPNLDLNCILNASVYIVPLGDHLFKVGATYNWEDKSNIPTAQGKEELVDKINAVLNCDFEILEHLAGVRPTVKDRRPLVGSHITHKNLHILNGLGTRGVMLGPSLAKDLFDHIENKKPLDSRIDIKRFDKIK